jgi:hypothetical protein
MTKFGKAGKIGPSRFLFWTVRFRRFLEQEQKKSQTQRFEHPTCFEAWKTTKRYQGAKMEEIQVKTVKIGLFDFGYRSIRFFQSR